MLHGTEQPPEGGDDYIDPLESTLAPRHSNCPVYQAALLVIKQPVRRHVFHRTASVALSHKGF